MKPSVHLSVLFQECVCIFYTSACKSKKQMRNQGERKFYIFLSAYWIN